SFKVIAPRGEIVARNGSAIVQNRTSLALQLNTARLPSDQKQANEELARIGKLVHMSPKQLRRTIREGEEVAAGAPVTLRKDVGYDLVYYLEENKDEFPGLAVQRVFVRRYPDGTFGAHFVGSV